MDLKETREKIAEIDREMAGLFRRRMKAAEEIASYKREHGLPVRDPEQEERVRERNLAFLEDGTLSEYYLAFLDTVLALSRAYQETIIKEKRGGGGK